VETRIWWLKFDKFASTETVPQLQEVAGAEWKAAAAEFLAAWVA